MTDKILTEAFNKLTAIEEKMEPETASDEMAVAVEHIIAGQEGLTELFNGKLSRYDNNDVRTAFKNLQTAQELFAAALAKIDPERYYGNGR